MFICISLKSFIPKCAKKHDHNAMIVGSTELDVGSMSVDCCICNILGQKSSIFQPWDVAQFWKSVKIRSKIEIQNHNRPFGRLVVYIS